MDIIKNISEAETEQIVKQLTESVVKQGGGEYFIYSTLREDVQNQKTDLYHYFENCRSEWRKLYEDRKWFMNDPLVEYARSHTEPTVNSKIIPRTRGQSEMLNVVANHGFNSGIIIPTHTSLGANEWLGMLYVGSTADPVRGEQLFLSNRVVFRALGMELMDWWKGQFKKEAMRKFKIYDQDIKILQLLKNGNTVAEISAIMDVKASSLYRYIDNCKDKLNVLKTMDAVRKAKKYGLLG